VSVFTGFGLPSLIFMCEVCVVTICTIRIISLSRGMKYLAALLGFFEITIWLFAIGQVMQNLGSFSCSFAFAAGFTLGNFLGVLIDQKMALGVVVVRVITSRDPAELVEGLKAAGYGVTSVDARGSTGPVRIVLSVIPRRELKNVVALLGHFDPNVFYSVDSLQTAAAGVFPLSRGRSTSAMRDWRAVEMRSDDGSPLAA
jgi:uncharacterized protein YebE (UPF0316 family)